jgi:broad specificity phosphatase PhoE
MRILLTRHGESQYNIEDRIGGNPTLTEKGEQYANRLSCFCERNVWFPRECVTSTKVRAIQTARGVSAHMDCTSQQSELDEINAGIAEDMTYKEFSEIFPRESERRATDKLSYRYPGGESYEDLIIRTKPFADQILWDGKDVLIVCHRAIIRVLLYHFTDAEKRCIPHIEIPLHQLISINDGIVTHVEI